MYNNVWVIVAKERYTDFGLGLPLVSSLQIVDAISRW